MDRLAKLCTWLALAVSVCGAVSWYLLYHPAALAPALEALRLFVPQAVDHPLVPGAAAVAAVAAVAAWAAERWARRQSTTAAPPAEPLPGDRGPAEPLPDARTPVVDHRALPTADRRAEGWRPRLAAHLVGDADIVAVVDEILRSALDAGASDIHIQPLERVTRITFRVDGELEEAAAVPRAHHLAILRRLKVLARLIPYQTDRPQDGHLTFDTATGSADLRLSVLPTNHGEKAVLRLARRAGELLDLDRLAMPGELAARYKTLLAEPQGVVVLTGPTGSGKTTTLYASLRHIHQTRGERVNIATLEDPVEIDLPFLNQTARAADLGFHDGLRAALRQDPDVLMIGEIRDRESADIAVQAGLTGHLILTTLHAESAAGVWNRLIDLGVEPFLAASSILATLSQRLVRRLCPQCRRPTPLRRGVAARLAAKGLSAAGLAFQTAGGCGACGGDGHRGRQALFELLPTSPALRRMITTRATTDRIEALAMDEGMTPLGERAVAAAAAGEISLDEALRVVG